MSQPNLNPSLPRYRDFKVQRLVDETLREGVERCFFPVDADRLYALFKVLVDAGVREFIIGSGPEEPDLYEKVCRAQDAGDLPADVEPTFLVLLNCWDATYRNFSRMPRHWIERTIFSFGMITHEKHERLFERVVALFKELGATKLKASVLNNFSRQVTEEKYREISDQITWAREQGIGTIRINDSVGKLYPETTAELCQRLTADFPDIIFGLHCHNDKGLALANQIISIYHGFDMVEGSLCGYGNRSGISPLEMLVPICEEKNIKIGAVPLDSKKIQAAAQLAEETFMHIPAVYRPVSGRFVRKANFGVLNIPDFLGADGERDYFLNVVNIHPNTIKKALEKEGFDEAKSKDSAFVEKVEQALRQKIENEYEDNMKKYYKLTGDLLAFYQHAQLSPRQIAEIANGISASPAETAAAE